jgi:hypothetical protein
MLQECLFTFLLPAGIWDFNFCAVFNPGAGKEGQLPLRKFPVCRGRGRRYNSRNGENIEFNYTARKVEWHGQQGLQKDSTGCGTNAACGN